MIFAFVRAFYVCRATNRCIYFLCFGTHKHTNIRKKRRRKKNEKAKKSTGNWFSGVNFIQLWCVRRHIGTEVWVNVRNGKFNAIVGKYGKWNVTTIRVTSRKWILRILQVNRYRKTRQSDTRAEGSNDVMDFWNCMQIKMAADQSDELLISKWRQKRRSAFWFSSPMRSFWLSPKK